MLGNFGFTEIAMLLLLCLLLFGAKRIPEIGSSIGKGIREFKRGVSDLGAISAGVPEGATAERAPDVLRNSRSDVPAEPVELKRLLGESARER